jgi:hypothetical protein
LIEIGLLRQLLSCGMSLKEAKSIMTRKDIRNLIGSGGYDFVYFFNTMLVTTMRTKDSKPVAVSNFPFREGCVPVDEYDPAVKDSVLGLYINVGKIRDHVDMRLK